MQPLDGALKRFCCKVIPSKNWPHSLTYVSLYQSKEHSNDHERIHVYLITYSGSYEQKNIKEQYGIYKLINLNIVMKEMRNC